MLKKLLDLFSKKEKAHSLESWLSDRLDAEKTKLNENLARHATGIKAIFDKIEAHLESLESAELKNKKVPKRALQIMEGNRDTYIRNVRNFIKRTDPEPDEDFPAQLKTDLESLGQANARSSKIMGEFFRDEISRISEALRQLFEIGKAVDNEYLKLKPFLDIKSQLDNESLEQEKIDTIMKDIEKSRLDLQKAIEQKSLLEKSIKEIKESEEYREHHRLISEKDRHEKKIGEISRQISDYFSPLRPGLKKYAHMSLDEKSVNSYIQDPVKALLSDRECRIIGIVKDMTTALEKGSLEMKDKKLEKTVSAATSFEGTDLKTMAEEMQKALQQKHDTEDMIRQTHVRDYDEAEYRLNHMNDKIRLLEAEIRDKEKAAGQIKPEEHRRKAMNMVKNLGIELEITSASA